MQIFDKIEFAELCKGVRCVDLDERFQTHIYLQNLASIQPRTSPLKFAMAAPLVREAKAEAKALPASRRPDRDLLHESEGAGKRTTGLVLEAVSKPNFARKYALESSRRDLHNALLRTVLEFEVEKSGEKRTLAQKQPLEKMHSLHRSNGISNHKIFVKIW